MPPKLKTAGSQPAEVPKSRRQNSSNAPAEKISVAEAFAEPGKERQGSVDLVATEILRGLYEERFSPGEKLLESELTRRFGVGRGSVREALRRLEAEGLVTVNLHRGASIRWFTRHAVRDALEVTENLAGWAARLAAERVGNPHPSTGLRKSLDELTTAVMAGDSASLGRARYKFFNELVALTDNQELTRLLPRLDGTVLRMQFRRAFTLEDERASLDRFLRVGAAVTAGDGPAAERAMREHIRSVSAIIERLPDDYFGY